ncbi:hypothetical protein [Pararhodobacter marinus]|uniref:hypothetical protein n=1 Tax=Pararhodobacter marinus TaxID=2184063 RepID=UPI00143CF87A|nr:hypothetical protein [Pararhodobacter marinus]
MSKAPIGALVAVLGLAVLGGCSHFAGHHQDEYVPVDPQPAPAPIYVEPVDPKYG